MSESCKTKAISKMEEATSKQTGVMQWDLGWASQRVEHYTPLPYSLSLIDIQ